MVVTFVFRPPLRSVCTAVVLHGQPNDFSEPRHSRTYVPRVLDETWPRHSATKMYYKCSLRLENSKAVPRLNYEGETWVEYSRHVALGTNH